ncbi:MAM domain-containing glycosylphosphatidylinositol anchor protein 2 [Labeo rohita]|uniref:MAM domain-containing glycosylphosphatidylinositol anchor protein 2 n=1 Tax=Labeo rohita TaxID=84645 RepID=A0ABQ8L8B1_LABRO|nr:MAM domain-containing glycosylphosphatidylinositol anchor protein 2 [Labeo rohita]
MFYTEQTFLVELLNFYLFIYFLMYFSLNLFKTNKTKQKCCVSGVFGDKDAVKSVFVTEGDSVTLNTDVEVQKDDRILWTFKMDNSDTLIAEIIRENNYIDDSIVAFRDRLQMDSQTGSLTIRNIRTEHSGLYKLQILIKKIISHKSFTVAVYGE